MEIIGHRGGVAGFEKENTLRAFARGFSHGAHMVECDLQVTRDDVVCINHDSYIRTFEGKKRNISDLSFEEVLFNDPNICSLDSVLHTFPQRKFVFELKAHTDFERIFDLAYSMYGAIPLLHRFVSFSLSALRYVKSKAPGTYVVYIGTSRGDDSRIEPCILGKHIDHCLAASVDELAGHWLTFLPRSIALAKQNGIRVGVGMVNTKLVLQYVRDRVDCVYTDRVKLFSS